MSLIAGIQLGHHELDRRSDGGRGGNDRSVPPRQPGDAVGGALQAGRQRRRSGAPALRAAALDARNTITEIKRLIGRSFNEVLDVAQHAAYQIVPGSDGAALVRTDAGDLTPQYVSALILKELMDTASSYAGERITRAVIGVPAYFSNSQRNATAEAAAIAGIEVMRLVAEPTLAALHYGLEKMRDETIVVLDLGGGTFDVSVLEVGEGVVENKSVAGDNFLGGGDFDRALARWIVNEVQAETGRQPAATGDVMRLLLDEAIEAKCQLSQREETPINLRHLVDTDGKLFAFDTLLTLAKFNEICDELFERLRRPCLQALEDAGLGASQVDRVLLVGGAVRMRQVQHVARALFGKEPSRTLNPEEAIGLGAGVQAGVMQGALKDMLLLDTTPLSLGVEGADGASVTMVQRNTTIPTRKSEIFSTALDQQTTVEIRIVQGEHGLASHNRTLGRLVLEEIVPAAAGEANIEVTFDIDANGILNVTARDEASGGQSRLTIQTKSGLTRADLEHLSRILEATRLQ